MALRWRWIYLIAVASLVCRQADRIAAMAETDSLTGLFNAGRFQGDLRLESERARRQGNPLCLAFLDLDGFKGVNDRHGHAEGDRLLRLFSAFLAAGVRRHVDRGYRIGGDEFAILRPGTGKEEAVAVLDRLRASLLGDPVGLSRFGAGMSEGVAELRPGEDGQEALRRADVLLYEAKVAGKNRIRS